MSHRATRYWMRRYGTRSLRDPGMTCPKSVQRQYLTCPSELVPPRSEGDFFRSLSSTPTDGLVLMVIMNLFVFMRKEVHSGYGFS